jgi:hypothetical protein
MIKDTWNKVKAFFHYSWSILIARIEAITGVIVAGALGINWDAVIAGAQTGMTRTNMLILGGLLFVKGVFTEAGRKAGTVTLSDGQLLPAKVSEKKEAIKVIQKGEKA